MAEPLFEELAARRPAEPPPVAAPAKGWTAGLDSLLPQVMAELSRLGKQGAMEAASALFGGSGFVPYGPGQYTPAVEGHGAVDPHSGLGVVVGQPEAGLFGPPDPLTDRIPAAEPPTLPQADPEPGRQEQARQEQGRGR